MSGKSRLVALYAIASLCAACSKDPAVAKREYLESANRYLAQKQYREASIEYRNALQIDGRFAEARLKLAETYLAQNNPQAAAMEYVRAADERPEDLDLQMKAGALCLISGRYDDAAARAKQVLARDPKRAGALILLGNAQAGLKDLDEGIRSVEEAILIDPTRSASFTNLGALSLARGKSAEALNAFRKAIEVDPISVDARLALFNYLVRANNLQDAEAELRAALKLEPRNARANRALALLLLGTGRIADAEAPLRTSVDVEGGARAQILLADYDIRTGRPRLATELLAPISRSAKPADVDAAAAASTRMAALAYAEGRVADAHAVLDGVLAARPADADALVLKGQFLAAEGRIDEALAAVDRAAASQPGSGAVQFMLGRLWVAKQRPEEAAKAFAEAVRLNPTAAAAKTELAKVNLQLGDADSALQQASEALTSGAALPDARLVTTATLLAKGRVDEAEQTLRPLLTQLPASPAVHTQMAAIQFVRKDRAGARKSFERAATLDPAYVPAVSGLVQIDVADGRIPDAVRRVEDLLSRKPKDPAALMLAAGAYAVADREDLSEPLLKQVLEIAPATERAYVMLGRLYTSNGRLDEAMQQFEAMAAQTPRPVGAHVMMALIAEAQGRPADMRKHYERALEIEPRAALAANNLAWSYATRGENLNLALQLAKSAVGQSPDQPDFQDTLGWIYYQKGMWDLAARTFKVSIDMSPQNPVYLYHLGLALAKDGQAEEARAALTQALQLTPSFDGAVEARATLTALGRER